MSGWQGRRVLIVGGSAGLGLALAKAFGRKGCRVGIVGRDLQRLEQARLQLEDCQIWTADVTQAQQVNELFASVIDAWQGLDMLVHAVGRSERRLALSTSPAEFQQLWELNFLSAVCCAQAALPALSDAAGSLIFIGSLASKLATANMGAYPSTKFALAAYAQQLRLELRQQQQRTHVMLVCPGPIERSDAGQRYADAEGVPVSARQPGGGAKLRPISADRLAEQIVTACERRKIELIIPWKVRWLLAICSLFPSWGERILARSTQVHL